MLERFEPLELNETLLSPKPLIKDRGFASQNIRKVQLEVIYKIYTIETLKDLFDEQKRNKEIDCDLRFLVDIYGTLWFARETHDGVHPAAPAHQYMASKDNCRTAGNLFFDATRETLLKINHKSGDYRPSFESLKWLLIILVLNEEKLPFKLPETLEIDQLNYSNAPIYTYKVSISAIISWVKSLDATSILDLDKQHSFTKEVVVHPDKRSSDSPDHSPRGMRAIGMFAASRGRVLAYDSDSDEEENLVASNLGRKKPRLGAFPIAALLEPSSPSS